MPYEQAATTHHEPQQFAEAIKGVTGAAHLSRGGPKPARELR